MCSLITSGQATGSMASQEAEAVAKSFDQLNSVQCKKTVGVNLHHALYTVQSAILGSQHLVICPWEISSFCMWDDAEAVCLTPAHARARRPNKSRWRSAEYFTANLPLIQAAISRAEGQASSNSTKKMTDDLLSEQLAVGQAA